MSVEKERSANERRGDDGSQRADEQGHDAQRQRGRGHASACVRDLDSDVRDIWPDYRPTRLVELPTLARLARVRRVLVKMECERPLGNFKALGGVVAALRALARAARVPRLRDLRSAVSRAHVDNLSRPAVLHVPALGEFRPAPPCHGSHDVASAGETETRSGGPRGRERRLRLPGLVCASAGNHGLAVAAAAQWAGTTATVYLAESANRVRAARIEALGARVVWTPGTYDDAVERAANAEGLLIADTSPDPDDPVVRDVMDGYGLISRELSSQLADDIDVSADQPSHLFVQAGVGGLAATLAGGLRRRMLGPRRVLVVEPQSAACVAAALATGEPVRVAGELSTQAEMLACGLASAPAVKILREHDARSVVVAEALLQEAATRLQDLARLDDVESPRTTPSGATGLAGLLHASSNNELRELHQLDEESCVLLVITEGAPPSTATIFGTS